jgi:hypothetical protein
MPLSVPPHAAVKNLASQCHGKIKFLLDRTVTFSIEQDGLGMDASTLLCREWQAKLSDTCLKAYL